MTPAKVHRIEITLSDDKLASLDAARQHEPRASFIKRALEAALSSSETPEATLEAALGSPDNEARGSSPRSAAPSPGPALPRASQRGSATPSPRKVSARQQALNDDKAKGRR